MSTLAPSDWSVAEARGLAAELRVVVTDPAEYDGLELFLSLCDYLDQLYGGAGFDRLLPVRQRVELAAVIQRVRGAAGSDALEERLDQPVNAAVTLAQGRALAAQLMATEASPAAGVWVGAGEWQVQLGKALQGLYAYLDELYGGPGTFTELLTPEERAQVAAHAPGA